jgi:hypothetical protein
MPSHSHLLDHLRTAANDLSSCSLNSEDPLAVEARFMYECASGGLPVARDGTDVGTALSEAWAEHMRREEGWEGGMES